MLSHASSVGPDICTALVGDRQVLVKHMQGATLAWGGGGGGKCCVGNELQRTQPPVLSGHYCMDFVGKNSFLQFSDGVDGLQSDPRRSQSVPRRLSLPQSLVVLFGLVFVFLCVVAVLLSLCCADFDLVAFCEGCSRRFLCSLYG